MHVTPLSDGTKLLEVKVVVHPPVEFICQFTQRSLLHERVRKATAGIINDLHNMYLSVLQFYDIIII